MRKELKDMENQKLRYFTDFCNRTPKSAEELACNIIMPNEMKIRHCYSENFRLGSKEFVTMILLDAIFILELFCRKYEKSMAHVEKDSQNSKAHENDYIFSQPCMERGIQHDLLLLENQLPFFVLEELYCNVELNVCHQNGEPNTKKQTLLDLSYGFFGDLYEHWKPKPKKSSDHVKQYCFTAPMGCCCPRQEDPKPSSPEPKVPLHFTDLVRYFFCPPTEEGQNSKKCGHVKECFPDWMGCCCHPKPSSREPEPEPEPEPKHCTDLVKRTKPLYTATKLDEAGLKLARPDSERHLLQIQFREKNCECLIKRCPVLNLSWLLSCLPCLKSTCLVHMQRFLEVPPLRVDDKTEGLFRNLMALEQCHYPYETYICDFIVLLDDLITTKADVRLLVEKKIIVNELGSSTAVTKLFNNLGLEIEESGSHYVKLCEKLNEYYESNRNRLLGTLARVYFSDFFEGTATVAGIIVLVLTLWNFQRLLRLRWSAGKY
ncbi:hypothetical protein F2P56_010557 [Juglans regia]|uniref:Uncharacterized protein n=2 Tax=Juglans regia TaxID=51240 RepID=A0A833XMT2_JUGRE|nr:UPF0481 protein At3g47200-like [Juglans regia]KAF5470003.1 hypothetical protein F2P56_010557 [Juglans regia]